ncbi:hypothetical protein RclHR1_00380045 [Rhizophagus clarus]|uniref:Uncharacterized protein n=1 Tax=Rhizophagus clarus TaxID=94130 RepID=A0A2Z6S7G9_9GLOM|nr:hypothetical protein RclHR1_00380045 [Rhizophagus clarus]GET01480.1 hypothetical protein GLOIN_2v1686556 [Rhizophagus clarus]
MSLGKNFQSVKNSPRERRLEFVCEKIDNFFESHDTRGYKFDIDSSGNVFIVEMDQLFHDFKVPNGGVVDDPPIDVLGALGHYRPRGGGNPAPFDIAISPNLNIIPKPPVPPLRHTRRRCTLPMLRRRRTAPRISRHREIPPVDKSGRPHARIMCEVAVTQDLDHFKEKCERWMQQQYQPGVYFEEVKLAQYTPFVFLSTNLNSIFGKYHSGNLALLKLIIILLLGLPAYQVNIPVQEVFWNPSIIGRAPSTAGYTITGVTANNFIIDLYRIQLFVLQNQSN